MPRIVVARTGVKRHEVSEGILHEDGEPKNKGRSSETER